MVELRWISILVCRHLYTDMADWSSTHCGLVTLYGDNKFESTLAQVKVCCLTAPSHYWTLYWLIIKGVMWHSPESNFTRSAHELNPSMFDNYVFKNYSKITLPGTNELKHIFLGNIFALLASVLWGLTTQDLTHWGRVTHICFSKLTIIGSDNGLSPGRRQAIIWTNAVILLIRTLGTNFSEILDEIHSFSFSKMHLKMSSAKWRLFGLGLNELRGFLCFVRCLNHQLKLKIH